MFELHHHAGEDRGEEGEDEGELNTQAGINAAARSPKASASVSGTRANSFIEMSIFIEMR